VSDAEVTLTPLGHSATTRGHTRLILGGVTIVAVLAWLVSSSIGGSVAPYVTVQELLEGQPPNRIVRATGLVVGQTISWDSRQMTLRFEIADAGSSMPVVYHGPRPDMLRDGAQAVVEGRYSNSGLFEATSILLKCPSKYAEET
jgi:cytochrome c-type biogenesis protein CcmE